MTRSIAARFEAGISSVSPFSWRAWIGEVDRDTPSRACQIALLGCELSACRNEGIGDLRIIIVALNLRDEAH